MTIERLRLTSFTAFEHLDLEPCGGINVFIGANSTGKTHLLKVLYAACDVSTKGSSLADKLVAVFLPTGRRLGRLVTRRRGIARARVVVERAADRSISLEFETTASARPKERASGWHEQPVESAYIPAREVLSTGPGFRSLYAARAVHFDETHADILDRAYLPPLRGPAEPPRKRILKELHKVLPGKVTTKEEEFIFVSKRGNFEFPLVAEGYRKLGLIWLLVQNGTLAEGSVLFWDEPEANLNPSLVGSVAEVILELQRNGVQVFLATHDHVLLKELELRSRATDEVRLYSLYLSDENGVGCRPSASLLALEPNLIADTFMDLFDRDVARAFEENAS